MTNEHTTHNTSLLEIVTVSLIKSIGLLLIAISVSGNPQKFVRIQVLVVDAQSSEQRIYLKSTRQEDLKRDIQYIARSAKFNFAKGFRSKKLILEAFERMKHDHSITPYPNKFDKSLQYALTGDSFFSVLEKCNHVLRDFSMINHSITNLAVAVIKL